MRALRHWLYGMVYDLATEAFLARYHRGVAMNSRSWEVRLVDWSYSRMMEAGNR